MIRAVGLNEYLSRLLASAGPARQLQEQLQALPSSADMALTVATGVSLPMGSWRGVAGWWALG